MELLTLKITLSNESLPMPTTLSLTGFPIHASSNCGDSSVNYSYDHTHEFHKLLVLLTFIKTKSNKSKKILES